MRGSLIRGLGLLAICFTLIGCGEDGPVVSQVSGNVTFKGKPVPAGFISFTPDIGKGQVRVAQIKDGKYDTSVEPTPGAFPGPSVIYIAGYDGKPEKFFPQGKQIFNPVTFKFDVPGGTSTKDFEIPESAGRNVKIEPTADE